jgi:TRAP-type C4-dicarboxylate transport system permease small subunit
MQGLHAINTGLRRVVAWILKILIGFMILTILAQIVLRRVFNFSMDFVIDINRLCFIWSVFLGAGYVFGTEGLIRFDIFITRLSGAGRAVSEMLCAGASLVFFIIMIYAGFLMIPFTSDQFFSTIRVSFFWLYLPLIVGGVILALAAAEQFLARLKP